MHQPRPYGLLVVGGELSSGDELFIDHELKKLTNNQQASQLESIRQVKDLPDGGYVVLQNMGGILKAIAHKPEFPDQFKQDGHAKLYIPMLYSGVITKARVRKPDDQNKGEGVGITITEQCRRRLNNYINEDLPAKQLQLQRFVIKPNAQLVPEFIPQNDLSDFITTQYVQQRPTWYSGAMAEVMQIVGGYGKQNFNELPATEVERAQLKIPDRYIEITAERLKGFRLPAYNGMPPMDGQFQYDYKFLNTHGVTFDSSNKPWLIRVGVTGVFAMPLPIIPVTTTTEFREYIESVGDEELLKILDRFGGMPSGEGFPVNQDFEAWRRAGVIIKVCDCADFYSGQAYSSACGWSFNTRGTEGFNTCYTYDDNGITVGFAYKLSLSFNAAPEQGWLKTTWQFESASDVQAVNAYLKALFAMIGDHGSTKDIELAIRYKIGRQTTEAILIRARDNPMMDRKEILYWDNLELEPIALLKGRVTQVGKGHLYHNAQPKNQPQIKFPFVEIGGCISFDFGAAQPVAPDRRPNCDTIMYGYYVGNNLKVVKYFVDWRSYTQQIESNFEPVMAVGSWQQTEISGNSSPQGHFYTSDFDFREVFSPTVITTTIKGEDKGFDSKPFFAFDAFFARPGTLWRNRYYTHLTKSNTTKSEGIGLAVCIPYLNRNAAILAKKNTVSEEITAESLSLNSMQDPTTYRYWTNDSVYAWFGSLEKMTGTPYPKDGSPVWVEIRNYNPTPYSDFADQGAWLPEPPYDITWLVHPNRNEWKHSGGGGAPKVQTYSITNSKGIQITGALHLSMNDQPNQVHSNVPDEWYFGVSPDEFGNVFYRDACRVGFGDSEYANLSETNSYGTRFKWGYTSLADHKSAHHFIGVINE